MLTQDVESLQEQITRELSDSMAKSYPAGIPNGAAMDFQFRLIALMLLGRMAVSDILIIDSW
jgi:hypothetical protein